MIESSGNNQYKKIQKWMKQSRSRWQDGVFVAEGWKMVSEALGRNMAEHLYVAETEYEKCLELMKKLSVFPPLDVMSDGLFRRLSDTVHPQGILAVVKIPVYDKRKLLSGQEAKLLCLEDIQDPGNMGTMIRTAEGAGMTAVVLSKGCVDLFHPKVVRATMGALFRVPFYRCDDLTEEIRTLQGQQFRFYAAHLQGTVSYTACSYEGRMGILIGNEANGLSRQVSECADVRVKIPMEGELESLNAAVSAALLMYEVHRHF